MSRCACYKRCEWVCLLVTGMSIIDYVVRGEEWGGEGGRGGGGGGGGAKSFIVGFIFPMSESVLCTEWVRFIC